MFETTERKGFCVGFANGWCISLQWGRGNYGDNYEAEYEAGKAYQSTTAEVCILTSDSKAGYDAKEKQVCDAYEGIEGWISPERFAEIVAVVAALPPFDGVIPKAGEVTDGN